MEDGHIRMFPTKFGLNPDSHLGGDVILGSLQWHGTETEEAIWMKDPKITKTLRINVIT